jgi:DNA excision repair protein ERCC-2
MGFLFWSEEKNMIENISISVREIIEFVLRSGDIKTVFLSSARAVDGIRIHKEVQKKYKKKYEKYESEVQISRCNNIDNTVLEIAGRVDGIILDGNIPIIDEIKSVTIDMDGIHEDYNLMHWAQGKMYAYMYMEDHELDEIIVQISYCNIKSKEIKCFKKHYSIDELRKFYNEVLDGYMAFASLVGEYKKKKSGSIETLEFPFDGYRDNQRKLMKGVYKMVTDGEKMFARAPTGTGKTIATIFPTVKSIVKKDKKIFYLTAKTIGREVAKDTVNILKDKGLILKSIVITAKDKICLHEEKRCDGDYCPYAKGHYDRINDALLDILENEDSYDMEKIMEYSQKHMVCPYEFSLDISLYCDLIICDYNYAFDPGAMLRRYFSDEISDEVKTKNNYVFLVDEAHNLVDRSREMYSAKISKKMVLDLKKKIKGKDKKLYKYYDELNKHLIDKRKEMETCKSLIFERYDDKVEELVRGIIHRTEKVFYSLSDWEHKDSLLEAYFDLYDFIKKLQLYDESYVTYYEKSRDEVILKVFCLNPRTNLMSYTKNASSVVFFSATLSPMDYFMNLLGGDENSYYFDALSPFEQEKLCLITHQGISTRYKDRENSYGDIVETIFKAVKHKKGNYLVFFPSYKYMEDVWEILIEEYDEEDMDIVKQEKGLNEQEKEEFLNRFDENNEKTMLAMSVLGGIFGEGIDLKGEKLSGVIIVGVGLPMICLERDLIKEHYDKDQDKGFKYSYMYPGFNKVLQAVGRVIRTNDDTGIAVLIDDRFAYSNYRRIFPQEWSHMKYCRKSDEVGRLVEKFWN